MPKISVIVPVYNVEPYIVKCLDSLVASTLKDLEILIIDDGSKDHSIDLALPYQEKYENITILTKTNGGLSDARNFGLSMAIGEYISFIDSDDYVDPNMFLKMYEAAKEHDSDIVCCDMYYVEDDQFKYSVAADFTCSSYAENKGVISINNSANNKIYRRSFLEDKQFPKGMWYEDLAVIPTWLAEANCIVHLNEAMYYYVQRKGSIAHSVNEKIFDIYQAIDQVAKYLARKEFKNYQQEIEKMYLENCLVMTTLRIKDFDESQTKLLFLKKHIQHLNTYLPNWYKVMKRYRYSFKQRVLFWLLKHHQFKLVIKLFR